ncbi:MAG: hypothetical protein ABIN37_06455 [Burkholderiaceae bacterium]
MKTIITLFAVAVLAGCAGMDSATLENSVLCTVAGDRAYSLSGWGPVGLSQKVRAQDAAVICKPPEKKP